MANYGDPFEALFALQRALDARLESDWLGDSTAGMGSYPPINIFQKGDDFGRERLSGVFDRTLSIPIQINPDGIRAEYRDGILALFIPRAESEKPRTIKIQ